MNFNRGQGTTEYLIILAIVIVIALVVVSVLGGFPSIGSGISQGQSKAYWGSVSPLAVVDWSIPASGTGRIVFQNQTSSTITITDLNWSGVAVTFTDQNIAAGGKATVESTSLTCGVAAGQNFSKTLTYQYNTTNLSGLWFTGASPLVGSCQ